nr:receptor-like serine/threonine-protein kinase At4g25390 [Tanacetum cinerariifolium]
MVCLNIYAVATDGSEGRKKVCLGRIDGESKITGCSGRVEDYVMECIKSEIKQRPNSEWITADALSSAVGLVDVVDNKKKKRSRSTSRGSRGSIDWWLDGFSGELWRERHSSHDSMSGDIPKRGGARAGVVEVALIGGWMDLVISLQGTRFSLYYSGTFMPAKNPALQPSMKEIVAMLSSDLDLPPLPVECSPSIPSGFRSHRKARQNRAALLPKTSKHDLISLIGDTADQKYPIYMQGPTLYTLCTTVIDLDEERCQQSKIRKIS